MRTRPALHEAEPEDKVEVEYFGLLGLGFGFVLEDLTSLFLTAMKPSSI